MTRKVATALGDTLNLSNTDLLVIEGAKPSTRDGNWRIRVRVTSGEFLGQELWMVGETDHGPWSTPAAGFV